MLEASTFGTSAWTRTARIIVELGNGDSKSYFLKVVIFCYEASTYSLTDGQCATEGGAMYAEIGSFASEISTFDPQFHSLFC